MDRVAEFSSTQDLCNYHDQYMTMSLVTWNYGDWAERAWCLYPTTGVNGVWKNNIVLALEIDHDELVDEKPLTFVQNISYTPYIVDGSLITNTNYLGIGSSLVRTSTLPISSMNYDQLVYWTTAHKTSYPEGIRMYVDGSCPLGNQALNEYVQKINICFTYLIAKKGTGVAFVKNKFVRTFKANDSATIYQTFFAQDSRVDLAADDSYTFAFDLFYYANTSTSPTNVALYIAGGSF